MSRRFYLYESQLFEYSGKLSRLKNFEIVQGKTKQMVYSIQKNGKKKFLGYVSKMPEKLREQSKKKVKARTKRKIKNIIESAKKLREKRKCVLSRDAVYRIGQSLRDGSYFVDVENTIRPVLSQNLQSAINFDWILRHLSRDGLLTPESIKSRMDDDYKFTSVSKYERDLFNAYQNATSDKERSDLWD